MDKFIALCRHVAMDERIKYTLYMQGAILATYHVTALPLAVDLYKKKAAQGFDMRLEASTDYYTITYSGTVN